MAERYQRMLAGMLKKDKKRRGRDPWHVYILRCGDGTLYTGITNDVERRFRAHQAGKGARYTRTRLPLELLYQEKVKSRALALVREYRIKRLPREKKEALLSKS